MQPKTSLGWLNKISHVPLDAGAEEEARRQDVIIAIFMLTGSVVITGLSIWDLLVVLTFIRQEISWSRVSSREKSI